MYSNNYGTGIISMVGNSNAPELSYVPLVNNEEENQQNNSRPNSEIRLVRIELKPTIIPALIRPNEEIYSKLHKFIEYVLQEFELHVKLYSLVLNNESITEEYVTTLIENLKNRWPDVINKLHLDVPKNITNITQKVKSHCNKSNYKKCAESISNLLTNFSLDNKEVLIQGCVILFKSYEMQLLNSYVDDDNDKALMILASEAVRKIFNMCVKEEIENITLFLIKEGIIDSSSESKILEKIIKLKCIYGSRSDDHVDIRDKNLKSHSVHSSKIYTHTGVLKDDEENGTKYYKLKTSNTTKFGYRRLFDGEDLPEHSHEEENKFIKYEYKLDDDDIDLNYNEIIQNTKKNYTKEINDRITEEINHIKDIKDFALKIILPLLALNDDYSIFTEEFNNQNQPQIAVCPNYLDDLKAYNIAKKENFNAGNLVNVENAATSGFTPRVENSSNLTTSTNTENLANVASNENVDQVHHVVEQKQEKPAFMFQVRDNVKNFTGRDKYIKKIFDSFNKGKHFIAVSGISNMGKTELVIKYAHEKKSEYNNIIYLDSIGLENSLIELADDIGVNVTKNGKKRCIEDVLEDLFDLLKNEKTLIICDDVTKLEDINKYLLDEKNGVFVLITTKLKKIDNFEMISLSSLEKNEAYDMIHGLLELYINMEIKRSHKEKLLKELVSKIECYPVAINLAAGYIIEETKIGADNPIGEYIKDYKLTLDKFCDEYKENKLTLPEYLQNRYEKTIFVSLQMALKRIKRFDEHALDILKVCSYLNPDYIDYETLYNIIDENFVDNSLIILKNHNVIEIVNSDEIKIYKIITDIIRDMTQADDYNNAYQKVFIYSLKHNCIVFDNASLIRPRDLLHSEYIFDYADKNIGLIQLLLDQQNENDLARLYFITAFYGCIETFKIIFKTIEKLKSTNEEFTTDPVGYIKQTSNQTYPGNEIEYEGSVTTLVCFQGHLDILTYLIDKGASVHTQCRKRYLLHYAAYNGHDKIVEYLLNNEANYNVRDIDDSTVLHISASKGYDNIIFTLIDKNVDINQIDRNNRNALHLSCKNGHTSIVETLLTFDANVNAIDKEEKTPLHYAVSSGKLPIVENLLLHKADVNQIDKNDNTPLHIAASNGYTKIVELLLENGAKIDETDYKGRSPLHLAAINGHFNVVSFLLNHHADINLVDDKGNTVLHEAAYHGREDVTRLLLSKNASVNASNRKGSSPLHKAAGNDHISIVKLLLDNGADVYHTDFEGKSVLHEASKNGNKTIVQLLLQKQSGYMDDHTVNDTDL